jgi:hypothetical protein
MVIPSHIWKFILAEIRYRVLLCIEHCSGGEVNDERSPLPRFPIFPVLISLKAKSEV